MYNNTISLPSNYFRKHTQKEYSNWRSALIREAVQNGRDAGATAIHLDFDLEHNTLEFSNNGRPMTQDILLNALLSLGGSQKEKGSVGGFGQAKNLLYFSWSQWMIHSGTLFVDGSGPCYSDIMTNASFFNGTKSVIQFDKDENMGLIKEYAIDYLEYCVLGSCKVFVDGEPIKNLLSRGRVKDVLKGPSGVPFAKVMVNKSVTSTTVGVFVRGLYMFRTCYIPDPKASISIELQGDTLKLLTANRDGLMYDYKRIVEEYVSQYTKEPRRAVRDNDVQFQVFNEGKFTLELNSPNDKSFFEDLLLTKEQIAESWQRAEGSTWNDEFKSFSVAPKQAWEFKEVNDGKICDLDQTPVNYEFAVRRSRASSKAPSQVKIFLETKKASVFLKQWSGVLRIALSCTSKKNMPFTPGFIWDDKIDAYYINDSSKTYFLINPHAEEFKGMTPAERLDWMMQCACHEVCHVWHKYHDEDFVMKYHQIWTKMVKRMKELRNLRHDKIK